MEEPIANPGLPAHQWRPTDVDDGAAKRAERQVAGFFVLSMVCTILFIVAYFTLEIGDNFDTFIGLGASTVALGLSLGGALLFIGIGVIQWARKLMSDHEISEQRHPAGVQRRGPRDHPRGARPRDRGVRHRSPPAGAQHAARLHRSARSRS